MRSRVIVVLCSLAVMAAMTLSSCEKMVVDEPTSSQKTDEDANLTIKVSHDSFHPYEDDEDSRTLVDIADYCKRFNFVLFQDGAKVKAITQTKDEAGDDFGQVSMTLPSGTYQLMVLAHSSASGNPNLSHPEEIQFTNAMGYSDTFCYYGTIDVTAEPATQEILLKRATTMVRFNFDEVFPDDIALMQINYTGESGVLNAMTGYGGTTNSKQEKKLNVSSFAGKHTTYSLPIYTFMRGDTGTLNITMTAKRADGTTILERSFEDVPIEHTKVTEFIGEFFDHESDQALSFKAETDWEVAATIKY